MRTMLRWSVALLWLVGAVAAWSGEPRIKKVLPHLLDRDGKHTLSPSLYERDAYQARLRKHPELCSTMRFDILISAPATSNLVLRLDLRGSANQKPTSMAVQSGPFQHGGGRAWKSVAMAPEEFQRLGVMAAWRALILDDTGVLAEQRSFLW